MWCCACSVRLVRASPNQRRAPSRLPSWAPSRSPAFVGPFRGAAHLDLGAEVKVGGVEPLVRGTQAVSSVPSMRSWVVVGVALFALVSCTSSPEDGSTVSSSGGDVSSEPGPEEQVLRGHTAPVTGLTLLADGRLASASGGFEGTEYSGEVRIWNLSSASTDLSIDTSRVHAIDALADGRLILASSSGVEIRDLSVESTAPLMIPDSSNTHSIAVLSDGTVALGDAEATVRIWDPNDLQTPLVVYRQHSGAGDFGRVTSDIAELSSGMIASAADGEVHVWDRSEADGTLTSSGASGQGYSTITELTGGGFASASTNGWVYLWEAEQPESTQLGYPEPSFYTETNVVVLDDDLVASRGNHVWVWSPSLPSTAVGTYERDQATALALLPDGRLAIGYYDGEIHLWDPVGE